MIYFRNVAFLLTLLASVLLSSCSSNQDDLDRYIADVKGKPAAPIPPIPTVRTYTPYEYQGLEGRDPFRRSTSEGAEEVAAQTNTDGPRPDFQRTREYLERFDLDTLVMVGTFAKESSEWALIRDPDGVVHRVSVGNYLGKNHGKVGLIDQDKVALAEFIPDGAGGWIVRDAAMALGGS